MNLTRATLEKRAISYFVTFLLVFGGISAYMSLGQLEDPEFTVKTAAITVVYPGASPSSRSISRTSCPRGLKSPESETILALCLAF